MGGAKAAARNNSAEKQQRRRDRLALAARIPKFPSVECANSAAKCGGKTDCMGTCDATFANGRGLCCRQCGCPFAPEKIRAAISELLEKCVEAAAATVANVICSNPRCGKKIAKAEKCPACGRPTEPTYGPRDLARQINALRRAFSSVRQCRLRFERKRKTEDSVFEDEELKILEAAADAVDAEAPKFSECCKISTDFVYRHQI